MIHHAEIKLFTFRIFFCKEHVNTYYLYGIITLAQKCFRTKWESLSARFIYTSNLILHTNAVVNKIASTKIQIFLPWTLMNQSEHVFCHLRQPQARDSVAIREKDHCTPFLWLEYSPKDHCTAGLQFNWIGFDQTRKNIVIYMYWNFRIKTSQNVDRPYSDTTTYRENYLA